MAMEFTQIPDALLVPGMYQEIDNSLAGETSEIKKILLVSLCKESAKEKNTPVRITSAMRAGESFGYGSPLAILCENYLAQNKSAHEIYALGIEENGTAYQEKIKIAANQSEAGFIRIAINEKQTDVSFSKTDTAENIASAVTAAVNTIFNSPIEASVNETEKNTVLLKSVVKGHEGIKISFETEEKISFERSERAEAKLLPITNWKNIFETLSSIRYNFILLGFEDADSLKDWADELEDRYSAMRQIGGRLFTVFSAVVGDSTVEKSIIAKAEKANSPHVVILPHVNLECLPSSLLARIACVAIDALAKDPSSNTYGLTVPGLSETKMMNAKEREALLYAGVATWTLDAQNRVCIERLITSYKKNADGERDTSYLDIQVTETVDAIRTSINTEAKKRFTGWKLASTEENFGSGSKIMSAGVWKAFLADMYKTVFMTEKGWTQDFESYKTSLFAEVKKGSKTRLVYKHSPVLIGQFYQAIGLNQFK